MHVHACASTAAGCCVAGEGVALRYTCTYMHVPQRLPVAVWQERTQRCGARMLAARAFVLPSHTSCLAVSLKRYWPETTDANPEIYTLVIENQNPACIQLNVFGCIDVYPPCLALSLGRYWPKNLYRTNPHFGREVEVKRFIQRLHERDIMVMLVSQVMSHGAGFDCTFDPILAGLVPTDARAPCLVCRSRDGLYSMYARAPGPAHGPLHM